MDEKALLYSIWNSIQQEETDRILDAWTGDLIGQSKRDRIEKRLNRTNSRKKASHDNSRRSAQDKES